MIQLPEIKPVPIRAPLPWALGRLWRMQGNGMIWATLTPGTRVLTLARGDLVGVWPSLDDPLLERFPELQKILSKLPRYTEKPPVAASPLLLDRLPELASRLGPERWRETLEAFVLDLVARSAQAEWVLVAAAGTRSFGVAVSVPQLLWTCATTDPETWRAHLQDREVPDTAYAEIREQLREDPRFPEDLKKTVLEAMDFLPGQAPAVPAEQVFLSFFHTRVSRTAPVDQPPRIKTPATSVPPPPPPEEPPAEPRTTRNPTVPSRGVRLVDGDPVFLETHLDSWEHLSAYAHQSQWWSHYRILGLTPEASEEEIRKRYRLLRAKFHPDRWPGLDERKARIVHDLFDRIQKAYETLSDPEARAQHDRMLRGEREGYEIVEIETGHIPDTKLREFLQNALAQFKMGAYQQAMRWLESARALHIQTWMVDTLLASLESHFKDRRKSAMERFSALTREFPNEPLIWWLFADALARWGYPHRSEKALQRARELDPDLVEELGPPKQSLLHENQALVKAISEAIA